MEEQPQETPMSDLFGLDRELVVIKEEHAAVITDFIEQHRVRGLVVKENAKDVAASVVDMPTAQEAANWCRERNAEKALIVKGPLGFWRNLFHKAHAATKDVEKYLVQPYEEAVARVDERISAVEREERRKAAEQAQKAAEALRKREEEIRLQAAQKLEERGQKEAAEKVLDRPMVIPTPIIPEQKISGRRTTKTLVASCVTPEDKWKFLKWVMESGPTNAYLVDINLKNVADLAKKQDMSFQFPGITLELVESNSYGQRRQVAS